MRRTARHFIWLWGLPVLLLATALPGWSAERFVITDRDGAVRDSVVSERGGEEPQVALADLAKAAHWTVTAEPARLVIGAAQMTVTLRAGNAFAQAGTRFVQLRQAPQAKDGTLWLPVSALPVLFPGLLVVDRTLREIRILTLEPLAAVAPPMAGDWTLRTVIVDPGHGGKDPGATGMGGVQEKVITLDIAKRLTAALRDSGLTAELTRSSDVFVSLQERTRLANERQGDLFISIHCNSHRNKTVHGIETYFLSPARTARAIDAALKENSVVGLEDDTSGYRELTEASFILQSMATSQNLRDSEAWAAAAARKTALVTGLESRGVDQAGFYVLMGAAMPALLVECGYLSHAGDMNYLNTESGRQKLANALAASILSMKTKLETSSSR